jgi:hypothetical protein
MSYHFDFDSTNRILRCRFNGHVTGDEFGDYLQVVAEYVARTRPRGGVTDLSAVTSFDVTFEKIRALANRPPAVSLKGHPRVIVASSDHVFGLARMFEAEAEVTRPNLHVVRTLREARAILGVEELHFEPIQAKGEPC